MNAHAEVTSGVKCAEGTGAIAALKVNSERRNMGLGRMMRVGLATSEKELPASDRELRRALEELGLEAMAVIWADEARDWSEFDAVIVRSCWNYHLHAEKFLAWIAKLEIEGVVVVNSPELIRWNAKKRYLGELAARGVAIPETIYVEEGEEINLASVCASRGWREAVVKPIVSASAHRTERRCAGVVRGPAMVQRYIAAIETEGEWSLIFIKGEFSHAVNKRPKVNDFRVQEEHGGTVKAGEAPRGAREFAEEVLKLLPHAGYAEVGGIRAEQKLTAHNSASAGGRPWLCYGAMFARVDVVVDGNDIWLMELEVIEPELYLDKAPGSAERLAGVIGEYLRDASEGRKE